MTFTPAAKTLQLLATTNALDLPCIWKGTKSEQGTPRGEEGRCRLSGRSATVPSVTSQRDGFLFISFSKSRTVKRK